MRVFRADRLVSGGEDGSVRLWDVRQASVSALITPYTTRVARPHLGKWIGDVTISSDWMVIISKD